MTPIPHPAPTPVVRRTAASLVLGTLGLTAALVAGALTYLPWLAMTTGLMGFDAVLLVALAGPLLVGLACVGLGLSIAAMIASAVSRFAVGRGLGIAGVAVSVCYGFLLQPSHMDSVVLAFWVYR